MTVSTKIEFAHRRTQQIDDITDIVELLFPGNRNQQHAAARILLELRKADELVTSLAHLERSHGISRRTLQRTRAKLARLGLIERVSWMNRRFGGREGWRLSARMSRSMRRLANAIDGWCDDRGVDRRQKDCQLVQLLR